MSCRGVQFAALATSLAALVACGAPARPPSASPPPPAPATAWDARRFEDLKLRYMSALDDRPADETALAVDMERRLGQLKPAAPLPDPGFFRSTSYTSIYDCASCHVPSRLR